jgi:hypothetical protein
MVTCYGQQDAHLNEWQLGRAVMRDVEKNTALHKVLLPFVSVVSRTPLLYVGAGLDQLLGSA